MKEITNDYDRIWSKKKNRVRKEKKLEEIELRCKLELPKASELWIPPSKFTKNRDHSDKKILFDDSFKTDISFFELPLSDRTLDGVKKYDYMTPIQVLSIPHALNGKDIIGEAPTGSGKTLCFIIPMVEKMYKENWNKVDGIYAIILTPTRELAVQIFDVLRKFKKHTISAMVVYGGKFIREEQKRIENINVMIGTPGRVLAHIEQTALLNYDNLHMIVLDEADRLIDMGFFKTTEALLDSLPDKIHRQNLMFSATLKGSVRILANKFCRADHVEKFSVYSYLNKTISANFDGKTGQMIHSYINIDIGNKINLLYALLKKEEQKKIIVFASTIKQVRFLYETFKTFKMSIRIMELHGGQNQMKRIEIFEQFKNKISKVLMFSTDLLGRGVDFPFVDIIIQFDCPSNIETYIHRAGRTCRGTNQIGKSILFLLDSEKYILEKLKINNVDIVKDKFNVSKLKDISPILRGLCARDELIKHLGDKYYQCFFKFYDLVSDKSIFNFENVYNSRRDLALSLGLVEIPKIPSYKLMHKKNENSKNGNSYENTDEKADEIIVGFDVDQAEVDSAILNSDFKLNTSFLSSKHKTNKNDRQNKQNGYKNTLGNSNNATILNDCLLQDDLCSDNQQSKEIELIEVDEKDFEKNENSKKQKNFVFSDLQNDSELKNRISKALRKEKIVIRKDGTVKLKGAANLIKKQHVIYDSNSEQSEDELKNPISTVSATSQDLNFESRGEYIGKVKSKLESGMTSSKIRKIEKSKKKSRNPID